MGTLFEGPRATTCISRQPAVFVVSQRCVAPFRNPDRRVRGPEAQMCIADAKPGNRQDLARKKQGSTPGRMSANGFLKCENKEFVRE